jgi:ribosomal protein S18 acetylase RimI-like enzyme
LGAAGPPGGVVRPAVVADANAIAVVHVATWRDAYAGLMPDEVLDTLDITQRAETWRGILAAPPHGVFVFVFERHGQVRGFVSAGPHREGRASGEVFAIYVDPSCQGLGAGRRLLEAATRPLAEAGFGEASLWVLTTNRAARGFYESQGWRPDGTEQSWTYRGVGEGPTEVRYVVNLRTPAGPDPS